MSEQKIFFEAIRSGDLEAVKSLVGGDASLASAKNEAGVSGVLTAVYLGRVEIRDFLIASGALLELPEAAAVGILARVRELVDKKFNPAKPVSSRRFSSCGPSGFSRASASAHIS